jgi:glyoxylate reductase
MSRLRVFVTQPVAESALARLRAVADVEVNPDSSKVISKADLCAGVARNDILYALLHDRIDKDVMAANPKLRAINAMVITPDQIDVAEATRRKIPVTNIPAIVTDATADLCFALLLAVARRVVEGDRLFRSGIYPGSQSNHLAGAAVSGKTLGLIGAGRIGQAVARRASGFGMKVLYADPRRVPEDIERKYDMTQKPFDDVLREADFVSLHPQLTAETRHLIGARELGLMKKIAFLINCSRGPVIDEAALARALLDKKIAGAGLDVYEHEPKVTPALVSMSNVVLTPHLGSAVYELREGMAHVVADNVIAIIEGRRPPNLLNPEIY